MPKYLISMTQADAAKLEAALGGRVEIVESHGHIDEPRRGAVIAGLDAVTDEECEPIRRRLSSGGPLYHAGGPGGEQAMQAREAARTMASIRRRLSEQQREGRIRHLGEHVAAEFEQLVTEASRDGRVDRELVLDLMTGAWETGRSLHHGRST